MHARQGNIQRIRQLAGEQGAVQAFRFLCQAVHKRTVLRLRDLRFDRRWGVETGCETTHSSEDRANPLIRHSVRYEGTPQHVFEDIMRSLGCLTSAYTFYDLGCGKGRVLIMAAMHAFARIVGVEFSPSLAQVARNNAARRRSRPGLARSEIEVVCGDAGAYEFADENAVIFLFNPFHAEIMHSVLRNIQRSVGLTTARYVVYYNPILADMLTQSPYFEMVVKARNYSIFRLLTVAAPPSRIHPACS